MLKKKGTIQNFVSSADKPVERRMQVSVANPCVPSLLQNGSGVQLFYDWYRSRGTELACPADLLDTVYPPNVLDCWISMFLREARIDYGGMYDESTLRALLQDIQNRVGKTYALQTVIIYDLPQVCRAWIALILRQPPPLCHRNFDQPMAPQSPPEQQHCTTINSRKPTSVNTTPSKTRFSAPLQQHQLQSLEKAFQPKNTIQSTSWVIKAFCEWQKSRNAQSLSLFQCPNDLLEKPYPPAVLDQWLAAFIMEARKGDESYYTPSSLNCLLAGFQRHRRLNLGRAAPNIIDNLFPKKRNALDQQLRCLRKMGIGITKTRAPVITEDQETQL